MRRRNVLRACLILLAASQLPSPAQAEQIIRMSTTYTTADSGLLAYLLPMFEKRTGAEVKVVITGTGKALELAKHGEVDVSLTHARPAEDKLVAEGYGVKRHDVMYNDFILVGPANDPAGIKGGKDVIAAMKKIIAGKARFVSRGDNSGTDLIEKAYWKQIGDRPQAPAYISAGAGMGEALTMAADKEAYALTDRATFAAYKAKTGLVVAVEGDPKMFNPYGIIAVNPAKYPGVNYKGATQLIDWITSDEGQRAIAAFRVAGQQVFFPSAKVGR
ncbi:substrate-binding domain-containing protein [Noviherbaspirillum galbum]|uniref:Solute-binding protein n=1 Tax=Noviherbaspirillum galbum TaxID=2709383 RepID=A0A6B3SK31_9BURK|nr:substrate-binding domain-containing protein [Noviherbaspirillum galbum]NEX61214.1 solute-binding protein [Noviherbaspirillum galbum]